MIADSMSVRLSVSKLIALWAFSESALGAPFTLTLVGPAEELRSLSCHIFAGPEEMITLSHRAESRMIFARGAVRAALWLIHQAPGRYTMPQVLGLN